MNLEDLLKILKKGEGEEAGAAAADQTESPAAQQQQESSSAETIVLDDNLKSYIAQLVQTETSKLKSSYESKLQQKDKEIAQLVEKNKESMTESEKLNYEKEQFQKQYNEQIAALNEQRAKFSGTQLLHKYNLADEELSFLPFIMSDDEAEMEQKCQSLKSYLDANVKNKVEERFKKGGRNPQGSETTVKSELDKQVEFGKKIAQNKGEQSQKLEEGTKYYFG